MWFDEPGVHNQQAFGEEKTRRYDEEKEEEEAAHLLVL